MSILTKLNDSFNYLANKIKLLQSQPIASSTGNGVGINYKINTEIKTNDTFENDPIYIYVAQRIISSNIAANTQWKIITIPNIKFLLSTSYRYFNAAGNVSYSRGRYLSYSISVGLYDENSDDVYFLTTANLPAATHHFTLYYTKVTNE